MNHVHRHNNDCTKFLAEQERRVLALIARHEAGLPLFPEGGAS